VIASAPSLLVPLSAPLPLSYCRPSHLLYCLLPQDRKDAFDLDDDPEAAAEAEEGEGGATGSGKFSWSNTDREYTYDELLGESWRPGGGTGDFLGRGALTNVVGQGYTQDKAACGSASSLVLCCCALTQCCYCVCCICSVVCYRPCVWHPA
jgi:hypothetical protein